MSEVASRPAPVRGRGSARGGRGGGRGGTRGRDRQQQINSYEDTQDGQNIADDGELGEMKKQYKEQLPLLKELFAEWKEVDLLFALQETNGDLESTIDRISEGHVSKFSDVKSSKEKSKPKQKDQFFNAGEAAASSRITRGRGGFESTRGASRAGRGERGGRGGSRGRGSAHAATNGTSRTSTSTGSAPISDSNAWDSTGIGEPAGAWDTTVAVDEPAKAAPIPIPESTKQPPDAEGAPPAKKTWAQMFAKPAPPPVSQKNVVGSAPTPETGIPPSETSSGFVEVTHADVEDETLAAPQSSDELHVHESPDMTELHETPIELTPSRDQLTQENVEHLPDSAQPAPTGTAASTVESSRGPDSITPSLAGQSGAQAPIGRPGLGGYATTAYKATGTPGRTPSFQRRLMEQQEAVVMPGNHQVDRTAVQFGSLGLNGEADVDEDREEAETRAQPPGHSPVAAPRASLPPVPRQASASAEQEGPKAAPGLPPATQQPLTQQSPAQNASHAPHAGQVYNQFGRYGQAGASVDISAHKAYDPFGQHHPQQSAYDGYGSHSQAPSQQPQPQSHLPGFSSTAPDYSQYYTADQRSAYQNYYNSYAQPPAGASQQDAGVTQQRAGSAFGASAESAFPTSQSQQAQSRYVDAQHSGHTTPNPQLGGQQQTGAQSQSQAPHLHQQTHSQQSQHGQHGSYPYNPYYGNPYYSAYQNMYSPYQQQNFGQPFGGKGGMYGAQPHHGYGQNAYDQHSSSPANSGAFGGNRESALTSGLGDYTRSGSAVPSQNQQSASGGFGGMNDSFPRSQGGFGGQQGYGQQQSAQQGSAEDTLKPFGESKSGAGPSPSVLGQPGRPGSATNTTGQGNNSGLPPPQSHQQGFGSYPGGHLGQMGQTSQYGSGLGGLGGHTSAAQSHQGGAYGGYGAAGAGAGAGAGANAGFGVGSYGSYGRGGAGAGGWGGNYGH